MKKIKRPHIQVSKDELIKKVIKNIEVKYSDYIDYFDNNFYKMIEEALLSNQIIGEDTDISLQLGMQLDNLVLKYLCDLVRTGNIDIEIMLIDKFTPTFKLIKKTKRISDIRGKNDEDILIEAIENYYGNDIFSIYLNNYIKKLLDRKEEQEKPSVSKEQMDNISILEPLNVIEEEKIKEETPDFNQIVENFARSNNAIPSIIDNIINILNIYEIVPEKEGLLKKFIYLKYGHYENYYFTINEIMQILKTDELTIIELRKKSLVLAKEVSESYLTEKSEKIYQNKK